MASMRTPRLHLRTAPRFRTPRKSTDDVEVLVRLLDPGPVRASLEDVQPAAAGRESVVDLVRHGGRRQPVVASAEDERRRLDLPQPGQRVVAAERARRRPTPGPAPTTDL